MPEQQPEGALEEMTDAESAENVESVAGTVSAENVESAENADAEATVVADVAAVEVVEADVAAQETPAPAAEAPGEVPGEAPVEAPADPAAPTAAASEEPGFASPDSTSPALAFQSPEWAGPGFPELPPAETKRKRRFPWRWLGALVTAGAVGAGCAYAVMAPQRTDLPGLKTPSDGRYVFASLNLPTLAPGQLPPGDASNMGGQHLADIRKLLLPAPRGAVADHALALSDGWLSLADSLKLTWSPSAPVDFGHFGWRHTAAESWKTPDGAETKIYLLQFSSGPNAALVDPTLEDMTGEPDGATTSSFTLSAVQSLDYYKAVKGSTTTWYGIALVDDTVLEIVYTAPNTVGVAPFRQEFSLQAQLLQ